MKRFAGAALLALLLAQGASATETVYRCGPEGREYSATPCPAGQAMQFDDNRSAEQQRQAKASARREAKLADQLMRERRKREAAAPKGATRIGPAAKAPSAAASAAERKKKRKPAPTA